MRTAHVVVLALLPACTEVYANRHSYTPLEEITLSDVIEQQFEEEERLDDAKIRATTDDGMVVLAGTVESADDAELAGRLASDTPGVLHVFNELRIGDDREAPSMTPVYDDDSGVW